MNRKLILIFHGRFPSEKAASLFVAKSAEVFSDNGLKVTLIVPRRRGSIKLNTFEFYNIKDNFNIIYMPTVDLFSIFPDKMAFWMSLITFSISTLFFVNIRTKQEDIFYSNEIVTLSLISFVRQKCFYEMHDFPESKLSFFEYFLNRMKWVLIHNKWKLEETFKRFTSINKNKFIYEPNAVDIKDFDLNISTLEARKKLELPLNKKIILYTGHLYTWKGVDTFARAMLKLSDDYLAIFVGGTEGDIKILKEKCRKQKNVMIVGFKKHSEIPLWQKSADFLILPNTAKEAISAYYTSPMKLYEYMASKKLIIASDIPSIREIIEEKSAIFFEPDNENSLAEKITESSILGIDVYNSFVNNAFILVTDHTWNKRANRIIHFMNENN